MKKTKKLFLGSFAFLAMALSSLPAQAQDTVEEFGISFDIYSRTTSETHHKFAAEWFRKLYDEGKLVEETTEQLYDEEAKQFLADRYFTGECAHCHNEGAYGDQC